MEVFFVEQDTLVKENQLTEEIKDIFNDTKSSIENINSAIQSMNSMKGFYDTFPFIEIMETIMQRQDVVDVMTSFLANGVDVNKKLANGMTLLHFACIDDSRMHQSKKNIDTVRFLLCHNAKVNVYDEDYFTPLHIAYISRNIDLVELLLQHGAKPKAKNRQNIIIHALTGLSELPHVDETLLVFFKLLLKYDIDKNIFKGNITKGKEVMDSMGVLHIVATSSCDDEEIKKKTIKFLIKDIGIDIV